MPFFDHEEKSLTVKLQVYRHGILDASARISAALNGYEHGTLMLLSVYHDDDSANRKQTRVFDLFEGVKLHLQARQSENWQLLSMQHHSNLLFIADETISDVTRSTIVPFC